MPFAVNVILYNLSIMLSLGAPEKLTYLSDSCRFICVRCCNRAWQLTGIASGISTVFLRVQRVLHSFQVRKCMKARCNVHICWVKIWFAGEDSNFGLLTSYFKADCDHRRKKPGVKWFAYGVVVITFALSNPGSKMSLSHHWYFNRPCVQYILLIYVDLICSFGIAILYTHPIWKYGWFA